ncbi:hypothetical protein BGZ60DRAFT_436275 [Tricladium varicosporioides]|nr:hypothetical protein BGZ60DRAFT_436275 [Hymenoscyphus varicosporioides]
MSSSTALLPKDRKKEDHPIFLRVCHSPWVMVGQKSLVAFRFITAAYLFISFLMILDYEIKRNDHGWLTVFEFSNVSYFLQVLYHWIAFIWTFMHLHYPHHGSQNASTASARMQRFFSPPRQHNSTNNRTWFSIFYYAANSFPHLVTAIYWLILVPQEQTTIPADQIFGHGKLGEFFIMNKFGVSSFIALVEIFAFSSIKRADAIWSHIFGTTALSLFYVLWAFLGHHITGKFGYYFFDPEQVGWDNASASIMAFAAGGNVVFVIVYLLTGAREMLTKNCEHKSYGYTSLPQ